MKKFRLLLLDANVVIEISRHCLWDRVVLQCEVHLSRTVVSEAQFYLNANGERCEIDLTHHIEAGSITVFDVVSSDVAALRGRFDPTYFEKLDPGETESLGYLLKQSGECHICSSDKIVYRVLGNLKCSEHGVSLEEILNQIGLGRRLARQFTKNYRDEWTQKGFQDGLGGIGLHK